MKFVPDAIHYTDPGETMEYITGWNDCRAAMLEQPAQRTWVGLTDEEAEGVIDEIPGFAFGLDDGNLANGCVVLYAKAIEAKLKEKNT